jgi:hypothetical protein
LVRPPFMEARNAFGSNATFFPDLAIANPFATPQNKNMPAHHVSPSRDLAAPQPDSPPALSVEIREDRVRSTNSATAFAGAVMRISDSHRPQPAHVNGLMPTYHRAIDAPRRDEDRHRHDEVAPAG